MRTKQLRMLGAIFCALVLAACSSDENTVDIDDAQSGAVTVVGEVISIVDDVPVDGGVTIDLRLDGDEEVLLLFESFMANPDEHRLAIYEIIKQLEVGDRVEVTGLRKAEGIEIGKLTIL